MLILEGEFISGDCSNIVISTILAHKVSTSYMKFCYCIYQYTHHLEASASSVWVAHNHHFGFSHALWELNNYVLGIMPTLKYP